MPPGGNTHENQLMNEIQSVRIKINENKFQCRKSCNGRHIVFDKIDFAHPILVS